MNYLIIWFALAVMFFRVLKLGYVVDDDSRLARMKEIRKNKKFPLLKFIHESMYGAGFFKNAWADHLATIILHGVNCSLIYRMTGHLEIALLYLINPINNQTVLWLNGRRYALSLLAVLVAWNFWPAAPAMAMFTAWLHVSGVVFPLLFLTTPFWWVVPVLAIIVFLAGRKKILSKIRARKAAYASKESFKFNPKKIILYIKTVGYHFFNCILPNKPAMYHDFLMYYGATKEGNKDAFAFNLDFWKGVAVLAFLAFDHSFYALWFLLFVSPWCNIYQVTMTASDRYCSIPNVGAMALLYKYAMMTPYGNEILLCFAVFYLVKYQPLFHAYKNVETFHHYHIAINPATVNSRFFLSKIFLAKKDPFSAFGMIRQGMQHKPTDFKFLLGFIECLFALGKRQSAFKAMEFTEKHIPFGEEEDCKNLFDGIRNQFPEEYNKFRGLDKNGHKVIHNNGKPYVKNNASKTKTS
jgi:hypothetical protein